MCYLCTFKVSFSRISSFRGLLSLSLLPYSTLKRMLCRRKKKRKGLGHALQGWFDTDVRLNYTCRLYSAILCLWKPCDAKNKQKVQYCKCLGRFSSMKLLYIKQRKFKIKQKYLKLSNVRFKGLNTFLLTDLVHQSSCLTIP